MVKKAIQYIWTSRLELIKYASIGSSGFVLDMGTLMLLKEWLNLEPVLAVIINQAILVVYIFTLNKLWTFRNKEMARWQFVRYLALTGWNYTIAVILMYIFNSLLGYHYILVRISSIALAVTWNFLLYKHWIFRQSAELSTAHEKKV